MENLTHISPEVPVEKVNFLSSVIGALSDDSLSADEKISLSKTLNAYHNDCESVQDECRSGLKEIKNKVQLTQYIKQSGDYKEMIEEAKELSKNDIKNIQSLIGVGVDGFFGIQSYIAYKNSPFQNIFPRLQDGAKGRYIGTNISKFIRNFEKINGVDAEILAIVFANNTDKNSYVFMDQNGNINITKKQGGEHIITLSVQPSLEMLLHESFQKNDITIIQKQLQLLKQGEDKKNYTQTLRNIIHRYKYFPEARFMFTKQTGDDSYTFILPDPSLNRYMKAADIFGDHGELVINGEPHNNKENRFFNTKGKEFYISHDKSVVIESSENSEIQEQLSEPDGLTKSMKAKPKPESAKYSFKITETNTKYNKSEIKDDIYFPSSLADIDYQKLEIPLAQEFGNWLLESGSKNLIGGKNNCGLGVYTLINRFLKTKGIRKGLHINSARNGANFDSILEQGNISMENPFIISNSKGSIKINSQQALKKAGLDITKILHKSIEVDKRVIDFPKDALPGEILVYNSDAQSETVSKKRKLFGHVEIKGNHNNYYSYYRSKNPGGSAKYRQEGSPSMYQEKTGFTGIAYSIAIKK